MVPHSKYQVVASPLGFTVPFSVADVGVTAVAALVTVTGGLENRKEAIRVFQDDVEVVVRYSVVYQKIPAAAGSQAMAE